MTTVTHPLAPPAHTLASTLRLCALESRSELLRVLRTPAFLVPTLLFPLAFYAMFAIVLPGQWQQYDRASWMLATYGVFAVIGPALFGFGVGLALERQNGWLELKRVSPLPPSAYFVAKLATGMAFALAVVLLLSALGVAFGGVRMPPLRWLAWLGLLLLGTLPFAALGLMIGTLVRGQAAVAVVNLIFMPMALLSGLWMPLFAFPPLLQKAAVIWPAWHLAQLSLGIAGLLPNVRYGLHAAVLTVMTLLFVGVAARRWRGL